MPAMLIRAQPKHSLGRSGSRSVCNQINNRLFRSPCRSAKVSRTAEAGAFSRNLHAWRPLFNARSSSSATTTVCSAFAWSSPSRGNAKREIERSSLANEEIVLLIFQLELDAQLQRALNYESYDTAQEIRSKRELVDNAISKMQQRKGATAGPTSSGSVDMLDMASEGLMLRSEMQRAVEEERYADAAKFRDMLAELDRRSKRAQADAAQAAERTLGACLRLGQRVVHKVHGYRGVVAGWDLVCCETEEWAARAGVAGLQQGNQQPFYHVLVDERDWVHDATQPPVAYVAQELLSAPELDDADGRSWLEVYGPDELEHPYSGVLFLGQDARGDLLPCRQLRDKFKVARRDVYAPGQGGAEEEGEEGEGEDGGEK